MSVSVGLGWGAEHHCSCLFFLNCWVVCNYHHLRRLSLYVLVLVASICNEENIVVHCLVVVIRLLFNDGR